MKGSCKANQKHNEPMNEETSKEEGKVERRYLTMNVESRDVEEGDGRTVEGYAAVFDTDADLAPLLSASSVQLLMHLNDSTWTWQRFSIMTRTKSLHATEAGKEIKLWTDEKGEAHSSSCDQATPNLAINLRMGLISKSSFAFSIKEDEWSTRDGGIIE